MSDSEDDCQIIDFSDPEDVDENEYRHESGSTDKNSNQPDIDPFFEFLNDDEPLEEDDFDQQTNPEDIPEFPDFPMNSLGGGGVFAAESSLAGGSTVAGSTIDGTSIIGDSTYSAKDSQTSSKYKIPLAPNLSAITNKSKKRELYAKYLKEKKKMEMLKNKERRKRRLNETDEERQAKKEAFGRTTAQVDYHQKTIENQRVWDETTVPVVNQPGQLPTELKQVNDPEVVLEENEDEFADYFKNKVNPKVLITTSENARNKTWKLARELGSCIPNSFVLKRKKLAVKQIIKHAKAKNFTSIMVINDDRGTPNGLLISYLPKGPTALFKLTNPILRCQLGKKNGGKGLGCSGQGSAHHQPSSHKPELILKRFGTRLGHRVSKLFASLYPHDPQFRGRQVVTLYNQRDYIFFRMHRYQFSKMGKKANLQEMGPRFTLKLRSLQLGTFDSKTGDYEWIHKRHAMDTSRRKFHL